MDEKILNWLILAEKFFADGDPRSMRTVAREILELEKNSADGLALAAESALYLGNVDEAEISAKRALLADSTNLRGRLVLGGVAAKKFKLRKQLKIFDDLIRAAHEQLQNFSAEQKKFSAEKFRERLDKKISVTRAILSKALCWSANGFYLAGEPARAASALLEASTLTDDSSQAAELYSKHLFLRNYRDTQPAKILELAKKFDGYFARVARFRHEIKRPPEKIHVGYISPDFREHALANFITPLLRDFDAENFSVTCYATGKKDSVTERLKNFPVEWRTLTGKAPDEAARIIDADAVDILVDLSGHSQDSCLPILAYKPAPVQICGIGYTATTGLGAVDYFLSDKICAPENFPNAFTEKILRLENCSLCYAPDIVHKIPEPNLRAPVLKNNFVTFGSFNNFAKVSDDVLYIWRAILEGVPRSRLILKGKIFSLDEGVDMIRERFRKISFPTERVEFRPYSPDYLEQYRDIDIALDTFPYPGGTTTCEALYMGVPVVTVRGKTPASRLGAAILSAADIKELITNSPMDYVKKIIRLSQRTELIAAYHVGLREHLKTSALMDGVRYMRELEKIYREVVMR